MPYLLLVVFLNTSIPKFIGTDDTIAAYADIGMGQWLRYVTATFELLGGIGLLMCGVIAWLRRDQIIGLIARS